MKSKTTFKIILALLAVFTAFSVMPAAAPSPAQASSRVNFTIETVQMNYMTRSSQAYVDLVASGLYPDRCPYRMATTQSSKGSAINVTYSAARIKGKSCTQILTPFAHAARINYKAIVRKDNTPYTITVNVVNPVASGPKSFTFTVTRQCLFKAPESPTPSCAYIIQDKQSGAVK